MNLFNTKKLNSTMETGDTEVLGKQRAKPSKIKARYSRSTCKNCITETIDQSINQKKIRVISDSSVNILLPPDQRHISDVAK